MSDGCSHDNQIVSMLSILLQERIVDAFEALTSLIILTRLTDVSHCVTYHGWRRMFRSYAGISGIPSFHQFTPIRKSEGLMICSILLPVLYPWSAPMTSLSLGSRHVRDEPFPPKHPCYWLD